MVTKISSKTQVVLSLLDRLIDDDPEQMEEVGKTKGQTLRLLCLGVKRDLENLLNTRLCPVSWDQQLKELDVSLLDYGLLDLMGASLGSRNAQTKLCKYLERVIKRYEPRFERVDVTMTQLVETHDRVLRIHIDGLLYAEPLSEPVTFDFTLEPETRKITAP